METIKSFVYLDEHKMYSLYSQIFEGLTESLTSYTSDTKEEGALRDDGVEAGRLTSQNLGAERATEERKYLHDYSYIQFESALHSSWEANVNLIGRCHSARIRLRQHEFRRG